MRRVADPSETTVVAAPDATTVKLTGLDEAAVAERRAAGLVNQVTDTNRRSFDDIVRANVFTRFNAILGTLLAVVLVIGAYRDALFGIVLLSNACIGIIQEIRAKRTLDRLSLISAPRVTVIRASQPAELRVDDIVLDDLIELKPGDQVPVDGNVLDATGLEVDESLLTGEADPLPKAAGDGVLSGSFVVAGRGRFRATAVGDNAYAARLAAEAKKFALVHSELRSGTDQILRVVMWLMIPTAVLLLITQLRGTTSVFDGLRATVAGTGAIIPEGLVLLTSLAFAVGVIRLGRRQALVQELPAVELLARVDVVCVDKTGTLTQGSLKLAAVEPVGDRFEPWEAPAEAEVAAMHPDSESSTEPDTTAVLPIPETSPSAGESEPGDVADDAGPGEQTGPELDDDLAAVLGAIGAAEERPNASLLAIVALGRDPGWTLQSAVPFSSARKWSSASFAGEGSWLLGAPDVLLAEGDPVRVRGEELAATGRRIILLAHTDVEPSAEGPPEDVRPMALLGLEEELRKEAPDTLRYFAEQGVAVKVISGDHPTTVGAVAQRVGVPNAGDPMDARDLPEDLEELADVLEERAVFGRVKPHQKRAMVQALQSRGHTVAMTGDGVNDVLALKDADIGVAMGSGSGASRAVAQLVLLDDNFASMPEVVAEGRKVIANIERVANLFVTKSVYAFLLSISVGVAGLPFPFFPRHLTIISSLTIGIPAFFLALAPNTRRARPGFVPRVARFAIPAGLLAAAATFLGFALARSESGLSITQERTTAVIVLFLVAGWVLMILARPLTEPRVALLFALLVAFVVALATPGIREFFELELPPVVVLMAAVGVAAVALGVMEALWQIFGWAQRHGFAPDDDD
jgi:cation-transporting P-type ATPase E